MKTFSDRIIAWHEMHGRKDLPWQGTDAYGVWVSEVMLQQTQVGTVIPYYEAFMRSFPDVVSLADAPIDAVLAHWSGLGYYARARNLHKAAAVIRDEFGGEFPADFDLVVTLPGIGRSTAGAILSLAFGQKHAILDGNVKRVLARHEAIAGWPGRTAVANELWQVAERNTPDANVGRYTQAIMDLGATLCARSNPGCALCPVASDCRAYADGTMTDFPGKKPKKAKPLRQTTMVLAVSDDALYLERRPAAGIWGGLWSLPELDAADVADWCRTTLNSRDDALENWDTLRHSFSHYDLDIHPVIVRLRNTPRRIADDEDSTWYRLDESPPGGMAAPVQYLVDQLKKASHGANG